MTSALSDASNLPQYGPGIREATSSTRRLGRAVGDWDGPCMDVQDRRDQVSDGSVVSVQPGMYSSTISASAGKVSHSESGWTKQSNSAAAV